ncbi:PucR family transcriptional regulator [Calidifontibacter terrae]
MATEVELGPRYPWADLPEDVRTVFGEVLPDVVEAIVRRIPQEVAEYARPLEGAFGAAVRRGVETAMRRLFVELPGRDEPAFTPETRAIYRALGIGEARTGRSLEALLAAYRLGARMTFRMVAERALATGLEPARLLALGESIFVYIDEVSAASIEGYADEQSRQVGERDRARQALLNVLLSGHSDLAEVRRLTVHAGWKLPDVLCVVVIPLDRSEGLRMRLGERALASARGGQAIALVPAPSTAAQRRSLEARLEGRSAWIGPPRPWQQVVESWQATLQALALPAVEQPRWVVDHTVGVVLAAQRTLIDDLAARRLAPLADLADPARERLLDTLESWLRWRGERRRVAQELHVHPQTVGYRLGQLRELFGADLEDPDARFELELVLRSRRLIS